MTIGNEAEVAQEAEPAGQRPGRHRLDQHQRRGALRVERGEVERDVGAEAVPGDDRARRALGIEQPRQVVAPFAHADRAAVARSGGAAQIGPQDAPVLEPRALGEVPPARPVARQAVQEDDASVFKAPADCAARALAGCPPCAPGSRP